MNATSPNKSAGLSATATAMLEARGLDADLCERIGLTSGSDRAGSEWIAFPFERNGVRVNRKFRSVEGKRFRQDPGGEQILWRYDCIADVGLADQPLIITEGELDCVAAIQAGFWRTVAFAAGAPAGAHDDQDLRASSRYTSIRDTILDGVGEIIIAVDADTAGVALRTDLTALLRPARCKFVTYPSACKDLGDVLREYGAEKVREVLEGARWVNVAGVYLPSELPPLSPLTVWRPRIFSPIDDLIPICPGHVSVWTGLAGDGKSTLVNACMWSLADHYGLRIAAAPFESTPQREYLEDLVAFRCGRAIGDPFEPATSEDIAAARDWEEKHIVFLNADGYAKPGQSEWIDATLEWFAQAAETAVRRFGCRIVVLDPWSQIDHEQNSHEREDQYVRRSLKGFKRLARELDIHVAIVAHPAKPKRNADGGYPVPEGYDISGAAHWKNAPDLGVTAYRDPPKIEDPNNEGEMIPDPKSTRVLVKVWKVKFHRAMNRPGEVYASLNPRTGRYSSPEHWEGMTHAKRWTLPALAMKGEDD